MKHFSLTSLSVFLLASCAAIGPNHDAPNVDTKVSISAEPAPLMSWADLTSRDKSEPSTSIKYGEGETEIVDLWLPDSEGPHPVVIMVHGGCWQKSIADRTLMDYAAEELRQNGMAVWNIEYRGVDEEGGGYPGTFIDVARAADLLPSFAEEYNLDVSRIGGFGHSAGGHLVTWLAGRKNLPADSPIFSEPTFEFDVIVNSGSLADLEVSNPLTLEGCLAAIQDDLTGLPTPDRPDVLAETSSDRLLPFGTLTVSVNGERDRIAPPELGQAFTAEAIAAGDEADIIIINGEGHVELIAPGTESYKVQTEVLKKGFGLD